MDGFGRLKGRDIYDGDISDGCIFSHLISTTLDKLVSLISTKLITNNLLKCDRGYAKE